MKFQLLILFLLFLPGVFALGIATPHMPGGIIELEAGESKIINIGVQKAENTELEIEFNLDSEIAQVVGENYVFMDKDQKEKIVQLNISIPKNALLGQEYTVNYYVKPRVDNTPSTFLNIKVEDGFRVKVVEKEKTELIKQNNKTYIPIIALVFLIIVFRLLYKRSSIITNRLMKK